MNHPSSSKRSTPYAIRYTLTVIRYPLSFVLSLVSVVCGLPTAPLHLSRKLYKSPLFMQNKPNVKYAQIYVNSYMKSIYEKLDTWLSGKNKANSNPNKPNLRKAKMIVNLYIIKDYRKKDDFIVRINKPNFVKGQK